MKIKELIKLLEEVEDKDKYIHILGNNGNPEDENSDEIYEHLEIWDDGDESITLFLTKKLKELKQ